MSTLMLRLVTRSNHGCFIKFAPSLTTKAMDKRERTALAFGESVIGCEPKDHSDDYYFCSCNVKDSKGKYKNLLS